MTYKELLLHPEWRDRRRNILLRDGFKCLCCHNEKILKDARIGTLIQSGLYHSGTMYRFQGFKESFSQKVLMKAENNVNEKAYIAYVDKEITGKKFGNVIAVRKRLSLSPLNPNEDNFYEKLFELNLAIQSFNWIFVQSLHVHHTYYQLGKHPWEYPDTALQTLCWVCHEELHQQFKVPYLNESGIEIGKLTPCGKCCGAGYFPEYKHVQEGICFTCQGAKYVELMKSN